MARDLVLEELRKGQSVAESAKAAGVAKRTVYRWSEAGDTDIEEAIENLKGGAWRYPKTISPVEREMLDVLSKVANDKKATATVRLRAANSLLSHCRQSGKAKPGSSGAGTKAKPRVRLSPEEASARFRPPG